MTAYYIMLSGLSLCGACLCIRNRNRVKDSIFLLISFVVLTGMSAIRYDVGIDYSYIYSPGYENILADPTGEVLANHRWEPGFKLLLKILMTFTHNYHVLFVVTSIIIIFLVMLYYWLHSPNPLVSVFLFVALSQYYCSMNFMRQMIAAAIAMYAFPLLKKRNIPGIIGYFAIVLLAFSFHRSALILIPFFFINLIPVNKYVLAAYTVVTVAIYLNTDKIIGFVTQYWYPQYGLDNIHMKVPFTPQFAIAVVVVFLIVFLGSGILKEIDKRNYLYVNYAFFTMFFVLMGTRHSILDRLSMYFEMLAPIGIAIIVHQLAVKLKEENQTGYIKRYANKYAVTLAMLLLVILGGGLSIHQYALTMDHNGVVPYKVIWQQPWWKDYLNSLENPVTESVEENEPEPEVEPEDVADPLPSYSAPDQDPQADTLEEQETEAPVDEPEAEDDTPQEQQQEESQDNEPTEVSLEDLF